MQWDTADDSTGEQKPPRNGTGSHHGEARKDFCPASMSSQLLTWLNAASKARKKLPQPPSVPCVPTASTLPTLLQIWTPQSAPTPAAGRQVHPTYPMNPSLQVKISKTQWSYWSCGCSRAGSKQWALAASLHPGLWSSVLLQLPVRKEGKRGWRLTYPRFLYVCPNMCTDFDTTNTLFLVSLGVCLGASP